MLVKPGSDASILSGAPGAAFMDGVGRDVRSLDQIPKSWGPRLSTGVASLAVLKPGPDDAEAEVDANFLLVHMFPQRNRELRMSPGRTTTFDAPSGSVEVIPAGASYFSRWTHPLECVMLSLEQTQLGRFAEREYDAGRIELLAAKPGATDLTANRIASLMRDELLTAHPPGSLYMESLATALMCHAVKSYSSLAEQREPKHWRGGLSPRMWRDIDDFIRENLGSEIALSSLAQRAGLSYSHLLRAFRQTAGVSPHRYIMMLRVHRARDLAATSRMPLKQIALQCGFADQSHMTTVMRSVLNETPGEVRRQAGRLLDIGE